MRSLLRKEEMANRAVLLAALACLCFRLGSASVQPVIVASSSNVELDYRSGNAVPTGDLVASLSRESTHLYCAVIVDDLELQDFSLHGDAYSAQSAGGVFTNVKQLMEKSHSGVIPSVSNNVVSMVDALQASLSETDLEMDVQNVEARSIDDLASLTYAEGARALWIVQLPGSGDQLRRVDYLKKVDHLIGSLVAQMPKAYTLLLTSNQGAASEGTNGKAPSRHLLATEVTAEDAGTGATRHLYSFSCNNNASAPEVLISYLDINVFINSSNSSLSFARSGNASSTLVGCDDSNDTVSASALTGTSVVASISATTNESANATLDFYFYKTNGKLNSDGIVGKNTSFFWELRTIKATVNGMSTCYIPATETDWVIAPVGFSFSCQSTRRWMPVVRSSPDWNWRTYQYSGALRSANGSAGCPDTNTSVIELNITGFQVQAFNIVPGKEQAIFFGPPIDCVGYFSGETWMGFFVGIILVFAVFMASTIFLGMETPDRFDDPKGKNIQVER